MPPKLGARALKKKAENAKAAAKAKAKFEADQARQKAEAEQASRLKAKSDAASGVVFGDYEPLPPAYGRLFCVPRDASRVLEIEQVQHEKDAKVKYIGPDYGQRSSKFVTSTPAVSNSNLYCIPYAASRVLEIDPAQSVLKQIGDRFNPGSGKYTDAVASLDYRQKLYAAPCRARRVLEVDPITKECREVGGPLGDPLDVEVVIISGLTQKSKKANGVYEKTDEKFDDFPYFKRTGGLPPNHDDTPAPTTSVKDPKKAKRPVVEESSSDDEDFAAEPKQFYIYCIRKRRWCLSTELGEKQDHAWCWQKGREPAPPDGKWIVNEEPPPPPPEDADPQSEDSDDSKAPPKEKKMMCTGTPMVEVRHPPKWWSIAYHPNKNRLYAVPYHARRVLMIDPTHGGKAMEIGPDLGPGKAKYSSLVLAPNGYLFAAPLNAQQVLQIDENGLIDLVGPNFGDLEKKYSCMVLAPNKLLYAPPLYAERVLEINCAKGNTRQIGPIIGFGEAKYACAAVGANGHVYCAPLEARRVLEIRCVDHEVEEIGMDLGGAEKEKYSSIAAAPIGHKLYAAPRQSYRVLEIDPDRVFVKEVGPELGRAPRKFTCVAAGPMVQPPRPTTSKSESNADPAEEPGAEQPAESPPPPLSAAPLAAEPAAQAPPAKPKEPAPQQEKPPQYNPWQRNPQLY